MEKGKEMAPLLQAGETPWESALAWEFYKSPSLPLAPIGPV